MRNTWSGTLSFGLVNIPVGLALATKATSRQSDVAFKQLHRECGTPIKQKKWCPVHDHELAADDIVKGWEASKGQFVQIEDEELEKLQANDDSRAIVISEFVDAAAVDPIYRDRVYYLIPGKTAAQRRPYRLLLEAMGGSGKAALGRFVRTGKESLCLVRTRGDALVLETLFLAEDVYSSAEISEAVQGTEVKAAELELAHQIVAGLEGSFDPATLTSEYRGNLHALLQAKLEGSPLPEPVDAEPETAPADLLEALKASVEAAKKPASTPAQGRGEAGKTAAKKTPARRSSRAKAKT